MALCKHVYGGMSPRGQTCDKVFCGHDTELWFPGPSMEGDSGTLEEGLLEAPENGIYNGEGAWGTYEGKLKELGMFSLKGDS